MADPQPSATMGPLREAFTDLRNTAREQMVAAWQIQIEQLQEQLAAGLPERIAWIFEQRFGELQTRLGGRLSRLINEHVAAAIAGCPGHRARRRSPSG